ncbi:hypothetical protein BOX15_Mlig009626g1 [Macrostomum lignano]|uniref:Uncharacterized protein n=1 Tax=Macrostomum lignano TaxID=282301 RepID=A0A267H9L8_9PLAT|nr:hypothetical protein BOX15_Mlig009626g1 [Macrostomum lignano]
MDRTRVGLPNAASILLIALLLTTSEIYVTLSAAAVLQDTRMAVPSSDQSIKLKVEITDTKFHLTCEVTGINGPVDDQKIRFFCPAIEKLGDPCFSDCNPHCSMSSDKCLLAHPVLNSSVRCKESKPFPGAKFIDLYFDNSQAELAGEWYCRFQTAISSKTSISRREKNPPAVLATTAAPQISAATKKPVPQPVPTNPPPVVVLPPTRPPISNGGLPDSTTNTEAVDKTTSYDSRFLPFARADFVFGAPALLLASLIVNLAFCIRCCLAKYYVSLRRRKREPPGCLAHCLCVSTVQVVEKDSANQAGSGATGAGGEDMYEEVLPRMARHQPQRSSVRTMETTYIEAPGMHRSRTLPPVVGQTQASLYYLQGVSDSMSRILYDDVPPASSRHSSRPSSPYGQLMSGRNSHSRSSLRGVGAKQQQLQQQFAGGGVNNSANSIPAVPEESTPFVADAQPEEDDQDNGSDYSGATRLELSRMMLRKADTLLREANSLLRDTAHGDAAGEGGNQLHSAD